MKTLIKIAIIAFIFIFIVLASIGAGLWYMWSSNLPYISSLREYRPPVITRIYSEKGDIIGRFWHERRILVPLEDISENIIKSFIAAEDSRFYQHKGIDFLSIIRAFTENLKAGRIKQGGSTITQQMTKSILLKNPARTYRRKVREVLLALQIEREFSKERILYLYLNQIYLGHGLYGVEASSRVYFGKKASELNIAEASMLAGLAHAPSRDCPIGHFDRAKSRQRYVLNRLKREGLINRTQYEEALKKEIQINRDEKQTPSAPYFLEHVRRDIEKRYGTHMLYRGGLKVHTTINLKAQSAAKSAVQRGLKELDKREGFRGPLKTIPLSQKDEINREIIEKLDKDPLQPGMITRGIVLKVDSKNNETLVQIGNHRGILPLSNMKWARKTDPETAYYETKLRDPAHVLEPDDVILVKAIEKTDDHSQWILSLEQIPTVQGALLCLEADTGYVRAMVGGYDFSESQFNRAVQAKRQPGSAFKPLIYSAALDKGLTPSSIIIDSPFISPIGEEDDLWKPKNYKEKFYGPTLFRTGLIHSRNITTIKILKKIGVRYTIDYAKKLGIESELSPDLSLALGSSGLSLLEITRAYSVFANQGNLVKPLFITELVDRNGKVLEENHPLSVESISPETAYIMTDLLKAVVDEGTGWRVRALSRPVAGKTGTTNDLRDAWYIGFNPDLVAGVWAGYDDRRPMGKGETGSRSASPIWLYFMEELLRGKPVTPFKQPKDVVVTKIDAQTGLLASQYSEKTCFQAYKKGTEPTVYSPKPDQAGPGEFFERDMDYSDIQSPSHPSSRSK